ncbi:MAG: tetratricopeptide repeat protein [bacterium]
MHKKILFAIIAFLLFLCLTESVLSVCGLNPIVKTLDPFVGFTSLNPLFKEKKETNGRVYLSTAENKLSYFNYQSFPAEKAENTFRIFCMGGSVTYGRPYDDLTSFCGWLREFLNAADNSRKWEVINCGGISYASYRITILMEELIKHKPDLFIVYSGNNEFLEKRTYKEIIEMSPVLINLSGIMDKTRIFTAMKLLINKIFKSRQNKAEDRYEMAGEVNTLLDNSVGPSSYTRNMEVQSRILNHFRFSLGRMAKIASSAGAKIFFIVPGTNLKDCQPFKSENRADLSEEEKRMWYACYFQGKSLEAQKEFEKALKFFRKALDMDNSYAELWYKFGKALYSLKRFDEAEAAFKEALDRDICPLRALTDMEEIIITAAQSNKAHLINYADLLKQKSIKEFGHKIPGNEYFLDHVHPTISANRVLSLAIMDKLIELSIAEPSSSWNKNSLKNVIYSVEKRMNRNYQANALHNLAQVLNWAGKHDEAALLALQALETINDRYQSLLMAGAYAQRNKNKQKAQSYYRKAVEARPEHAEAYKLLAGIMVENGELQQAENLYSRALKFDEKDPDLHHKMGIILAKLKQPGKAVEHFYKALKINSGDADLHYNLGVALAGLGRNKEAVIHYSRALEINPNDVQAKAALGKIQR